MCLSSSSHSGAQLCVNAIRNVCKFARHGPSTSKKAICSSAVITVCLVVSMSDVNSFLTYWSLRKQSHHNVNLVSSSETSNQITWSSSAEWVSLDSNFHLVWWHCLSLILKFGTELYSQPCGWLWVVQWFLQGQCTFINTKCAGVNQKAIFSTVVPDVKLVINWSDSVS